MLALLARLSHLAVRACNMVINIEGGGRERGGLARLIFILRDHQIQRRGPSWSWLGFEKRRQDRLLFTFLSLPSDWLAPGLEL